MQDEEWRSIPAFPRYGVSNYGRIESRKSNLILKPTRNQHGHLKVNLTSEDGIRTRQINQLVAHAYLGDPPRVDCQSIIHLDGDKTNCHATNLAWRPRHFALVYHSQFEDPLFETAYVPVLDITNNVPYETAQDAAIQHGLLFREILRTARERTYVWPTFQQFRILSE